MKEIFWLDSTPTQPGKFVLRVRSELLGCGLKEGGSWNVLPARILGISYPDWLRLCRDEFGAELVGKKSIYICPYFESNPNTRGLVRLLNKCADIMMADYNIHQLEIAASQKDGVAATQDY